MITCSIYTALGVHGLRLRYARSKMAWTPGESIAANDSFPGGSTSKVKEVWHSFRADLRSGRLAHLRDMSRALPIRTALYVHTCFFLHPAVTEPCPPRCGAHQPPESYASRSPAKTENGALTRGAVPARGNRRSMNFAGAEDHQKAQYAVHVSCPLRGARILQWLVFNAAEMLCCIVRED